MSRIFRFFDRNSQKNAYLYTVNFFHQPFASHVFHRQHGKEIICHHGSGHVSIILFLLLHLKYNYTRSFMQPTTHHYTHEAPFIHYISHLLTKLGGCSSLSYPWCLNWYVRYLKGNNKIYLFVVCIQTVGIDLMMITIKFIRFIRSSSKIHVS